MEAPVFYDPSGRRRRWSKRILLGLIIVLVGVAVGFGATILNVPPPIHLNWVSNASSRAHCRARSATSAAASAVRRAR